eukprot:gene16914-12411_t
MTARLLLLGVLYVVVEARSVEKVDVAPAVDGRLRLAGSYIVAETAAVAERVQAVSHYGNPAAGCESDEQSYQVSGVDGSFCSPKCSSDNACPHDYPS